MGFTACLKSVLNHEGIGYEDENSTPPTDQPTNSGIIMDDLITFYAGAKKPTLDDLKNLSQDDVAAIYKKLYWDAMALDQITIPVFQQLLFDQGVLAGINQSVMCMQKAVSVTADGIMGPASIECINISTHCIDRIQKKFVCNMQNHYIDIVVKHPEKIIFLKGWLSRTQDLLYYS